MTNDDTSHLKSEYELLSERLAASEAARKESNKLAKAMSKLHDEECKENQELHDKIQSLERDKARLDYGKLSFYREANSDGQWSSWKMSFAELSPNDYRQCLSVEEVGNKLNENEKLAKALENIFYWAQIITKPKQS